MFSQQYKCESSKAGFLSKESLERHVSTQGMYNGLLGMFFYTSNKNISCIKFRGFKTGGTWNAHAPILSGAEFAKFFAFLMAISVRQTLILAPWAVAVVYKLHS